MEESRWFFSETQEQKRLKYKGRKKDKKIDPPSCDAVEDEDDCWSCVRQLLSEGKGEDEEVEWGVRGWVSNNIPVSELISATMTG